MGVTQGSHGSALATSKLRRAGETLSGAFGDGVPFEFPNTVCFGN
jgi:hypothetical protein